MSNNFEDLQKQVADLTARVWRLEQASQANATQQPRNMPAAPSEAVAAAPRLSGKVQATTRETRIGSQLFNRIGIIALLIGMAWFLKLAIDNEWIGPISRVLIGILCGSGIIAWSERFRRQGYRAFSYSMKALGTGILY